VPRAFRRDAAENEVGTRSVDGGGLELPGFTIEQWFLARRIPGHHRGGFRAWVRENGGDRRRSLSRWDAMNARWLASTV